MTVPVVSVQWSDLIAILCFLLAIVTLLANLMAWKESRRSTDEVVENDNRNHRLKVRKEKEIEGAVRELKNTLDWGDSP